MLPQQTGFTSGKDGDTRLIEGLDQLGYLLSFDDQITAYEQQRT